MPPENSRNSKGFISGPQGFVGVNSRPKGTRKMTHLETRKMLTQRGLIGIRKKLDEWKSEVLIMAAAKLEERREEEMKSTTKCSALSSAQSYGISKSSTINTDDKTAKNSSGNSADDGKSEVPLLSMNVRILIFTILMRIGQKCNSKIIKSGLHMMMMIACLGYMLLSKK